MMTSQTTRKFIIIIEDSSLIMKKDLEMEAKSYQKEEQQSFQLSLSFNFKIQYNQYSTLFKKLKAIATEVTIRNDIAD